MAIVASTNQTISTWAQGIYNVKETLKLAGWQVLSSSDGTTYNSTSDIITSASSGANGLGNTSAWFRIQSPDGYAEYVFQKGSDVNDQNWTVVFSGDTVSGGFIGGSPDATTIPTATDGIGLRDPGAQLFSQTIATAAPRFHVVADDAAPYTWWFGSWQSTTGTLNNHGGMIHDVCTALTPGDPSGYISHVSKSSFTQVGDINGINGPGATSENYHLVCRTTNNSGWTVPEGHSFGIPASYFTVNMYSNSIANPLTLKDELLPVIYTISGNNANNFAWKGVATMMRWKSIPRPVTSTYTVNTTRDRVIFDSISLPWDGSVPLV